MSAFTWWAILSKGHLMIECLFICLRHSKQKVCPQGRDKGFFSEWLYYLKHTPHSNIESIFYYQLYLSYMNFFMTYFIISSNNFDILKLFKFKSCTNKMIQMWHHRLKNKEQGFKMINLLPFKSHYNKHFMKKTYNVCLIFKISQKVLIIFLTLIRTVICH